jgi:hypothetical protein
MTLPDPELEALLLEENLIEARTRYAAAHVAVEALAQAETQLTEAADAVTHAERRVAVFREFCEMFPEYWARRGANV